MVNVPGMARAENLLGHFLAIFHEQPPNMAVEKSRNRGERATEFFADDAIAQPAAREHTTPYSRSNTGSSVRIVRTFFCLA